MTRPLTRLAGLAALLMLAACAGRPSVVDPDTAFVLDGRLTLQPQMTWDREEEGLVETWTATGRPLDKVEFLQGASDGDPLVYSFSYEYRFVQGNDDLSFPTFREGMTGLEIHDLYVASLTKIGITGISTRDVRPWQVDGHPGFRFEFSHHGDDGRERRGFAVGFLLDDELWLIAYTSGSLASYQVYKDKVEALLASIKLR